MQWAFDPDGTKRWEFRATDVLFGTEQFFNISPVITDNGLIIAAANPPLNVGGPLYAIKPDGTLAWQFDSWKLGRMPALVPTGELLVATEGRNRFFALNTDGTLKWEIASPPDIFTAPSVRGDGVSFLPAGWAVRPDGSTIWTFRRRVGRSTAAIGRDGTTYFERRKVLRLERGRHGEVAMAARDVGEVLAGGHCGRPGLHHG
jgi:outer membrane protein assembly factor BamB